MLKVRSSPLVSRGVTVTDVARQARVSAGTVSRVMLRRPDVDPEISKRVWFASRELGFVPKRSRPGIAVIAGNMEEFSPIGYVGIMISLLAKQLAARDYPMELLSSNDLELAREAHILGVLGVVFDDRIAALQAIPKLPILTINRPMLERDIHSIRTDHYQQGVLATEHLLARGHQRIAFLEMLANTWGTQQRLAGYRATLEKTGLKFDPALVHYTVGQPLYDILARLTKNGVTALVNFSEESSFETIHILTNILRLSIPRDISLVTVESMPIFQYLTPPQTVIRQPWAQVAQVAVDAILKLGQEKQDRRNNRSELIDITLPCELVARDSVASPRPT